MALIDIFNDNAFSMVELTAALKDIDYQPGTLSAMNIFTKKGVRTESVAMERQAETIRLVPTTPRGSAPTPNRGRNPRNIRDFRGVRLALSDRITASEIQNIRAFGSETELKQVQTEVAERMTEMRNDMELTKENMRLGAVQGIVLDADGSELYNWFTLWGITPPASITFNFNTLVDGKFREKCAQIIREMARAAKGSWVNTQSRVTALCGDVFYDNLVRNAEVRETYKGWQAAASLREEVGAPWEIFPFGGIDWMNYRGTDDDSSTVGIKPNEVKLFISGARDLFMEIYTPGEFFDTINQPGQEVYALTIPDDKRNAFVDVEEYSYPLFACTRPATLRKGTVA